MRLRQNLVAIFSTFIQFEADQFSNWVSDPQLRRNMENCLAQQSVVDRSDRFWGLYWYKDWQIASQSQKKRARAHLAAYLQEAGYWAARKATTDFRQLKYEVSDCFQIALSSLDRILQGFDPLQNSNLKGYASVIFANNIRAILRQRQEIDICSPWALLRKLSQKRLLESLQQAGLAAEAIDCHILAWKCFKTQYIPSGGSPPTRTRQLPKPDESTLAAIANQYNQDRYTQLNTPGATLTSQTLEKYLLTCVKAARAYLYPTVTSIHTPTLGEEGGELLDILPESESESLLSDIIAQEEQQQRLSQQAQMTQVLSNVLTQMTPEFQQLLDLYYAQGLTQQAIAKQLATKQYTVSRRLTKARQTLLQQLVQWSQQTLHISLTSDILDSISTLLEEWLTTHYASERFSDE